MGDLLPRTGVRYLRSTGEFQSLFATDANCGEFLDWLQWPGGFSRCRQSVGWALADGRYKALRRRRVHGKKSLIGVAVEVRQPRGYGRCRMEIAPDASVGSLHPFLTRHVEPGPTVIIDGKTGSHEIIGLSYAHVWRSQRPACARREDPGKLVPRGHRVASLAKRWLLGTPQGSVEDPHLQSCLNEICFRFNGAPGLQFGLALISRARIRVRTGRTETTTCRLQPDRGRLRRLLTF